MKSSIFNRNDFSLCSAPVPRGYPQSQTHAGISYSRSGMGGYQFWLITTPYPLIKRSNILSYIKFNVKRFNPFTKMKIAEDFENPLLYFGNLDNNGMPPTKFKPYAYNPLMNKPRDKSKNGSFCSDPDIFIKDNNIFFLVRTVIRDYKGQSFDEKIPRTSIHLLTGNIINGSLAIKHSKEILHKFSTSLVSPSLIFYNDKYYLITLKTNSYNDGSPCQDIVIRYTSDINLPFTNQYSLSIDRGDYEPWHMSVFNYKNELYAIIACVKRGEKGRCYQMMGKFNKDLTTLKIFQKPLTTLNSYRGSACVTENGLFVLYSTTVRENFDESKSVDGRDVVMAEMPFDKLLRSLVS